MKRCILLAGGPFSEWKNVSVEKVAGDLIVTCDTGYAAALKLGIKPDLAVGDFDSYQGDLSQATEVYIAPPEKDDTDTMLGVKMALERGCREFLIYGAFGGRLDHTLANLQMLIFLCENGASGEIISEDNRAWVVRSGTLKLPYIDGWYLSVFAWDGICTGVTLRGVAYPLTDAVLTPSFPLGVSNEFVDEEAQITVERGTLLVVASREAK